LFLPFLLLSLSFLFVIPEGDLLYRPFHLQSVIAFPQNPVISTEASRLYRDAQRRDLLLPCPCIAEAALGG
jgi:hypothetical protein